MKKLLVISLILFCNIALAADPEKDFQNHIDKIYSFYPSTLTDKQRGLKSKELDVFWNLVMSDKSKYLPLLRKELQDYENNKFFLFDGASLLFRATKAKGDLQICADAIAHTRLEDIQGTSYFYFTMELGKNGINTYKAIENILDYPDFSAFIPQHALTLKQNHVVIVLLPADRRRTLCR